MMTLNQILRRLERVIRSHKQISSYHFGDALKRLESSDVHYAACFVDLVDGRIDSANKVLTYSVEILLADLVNVSDSAKDNEVEVLSDLARIAEDIFSIVQMSAWDDWDIEKASTLGFFREKFTDETAAVRMVLNISIPYLTNRCQIPIDAILQETGEPILSETRELLKPENSTR